MKTIPLTKGFVTMVDDEDYETVCHSKWQYLQGRKTGYAYRNTKATGCELMHRVLLGCKRGDGTEGDHRDGNGLNNQRYNLRKSTKSQNICNASKRCDNSSGFIGVSFNKRRKKFQARVNLDGCLLFSKFFTDAKTAAIERDKAALLYHGEFATLNFPELFPKTDCP